jgi:hypothetical protein
MNLYNCAGDLAQVSGMELVRKRLVCSAVWDAGSGGAGVACWLLHPVPYVCGHLRVY